MSAAISVTRLDQQPPTALASQIVALLVARPGLWRNAFESYLRALPQLKVGAVCNDLNAALRYVQHMPVHTVVLEVAVCDADLSSAAAALTRIAPTLNLIFIVETLADYQAAQASCSDRVWLKPLLPQPLDIALFIQTPQTPD